MRSVFSGTGVPQFPNPPARSHWLLYPPLAKGCHVGTTLGVGHGEGALGALRRWHSIGGAVYEADSSKQVNPQALAFTDSGTFSTATAGRTCTLVIFDGLVSGPVDSGGPGGRHIELQPGHLRAL